MRISILMLTIPLIFPFFFFSNKFCHLILLSSFENQSLNFVYVHLQRVEVYCVKENHDYEIYFVFFLPFSFIHLSLQCNALGNLCQRNYSPRILKFGTKIRYNYFYRVRGNQHSNAYHCLYLSLILFLQ